MVTLIVFGVLFVLWIALNMRTSRVDGELVRKLHPYRWIMPYIMRTRNESVVYFDTYVKADALLDYLEKAKERFDCDITHALVAAGGIGLAENPRMNQFIAGRRLYQRKGRFLTFSMKRKAMDKKAKLAVVKLELKDGQTFKELCDEIGEQIGEQRSEKRTYTDKELDLFRLLPRPLMRAGFALFQWADYYGLLPKSFIDGDGMYTSIFCANLGSVGMGAGFHHLYEWGNCPLFMMVGKIEDRAMVVDGEVVVQKTLHIRFSYDERIDDGLTSSYGIASAVRVLEDPHTYLACLASDGSDDKPLATG